MRFLFPLFLILASCSRTINVETNTFADLRVIPYGFPPLTSFAIISSQENTMLNKEVAGKIARLLSIRGYRLTDASQADYLLAYTFAMTSESKTVEVATYVPGPTETIHGIIGCMPYEEERQGPGSIIYTPEQITLFHRDLFLTVTDRRTSNQVWEASVSSEGRTSDLRDILDYLLVTSFTHLGHNTNKNLHLKVDLEDEGVAWLRH